MEFSTSNVSAASDGDAVVVTIDGVNHRLSRDAARALSDAVGDALVSREEFLRTVGEHREDGSYVVARRGADSAGNRKVFDSFDRLRRLYERLPGEFGAEALDRTGITGSRRHMLVRHFAEHPAFDCTTVSRNPLRVAKRDPTARPEEPIAAD